MHRRISEYSRLSDTLDSINRLIYREGMGALSLRSIARAVQISPSALHLYFEGRGRMFWLAGELFARERLEDIGLRTYDEGMAAFLPSDDDLWLARAWLGWRELGQSFERLREVVADHDDAVRAEIARVAGLDASSEQLELVQAVVDGLLVAITRPVRPMPLERARTLLGQAADRLAPAAATAP